jgi:flavin-dependent dehydrogenase
LTGEGIGQALETGIAAAQSIDAGSSPREVRSHYSRAIDKTLLADHRMSVVLSAVLARPFFARLVLAVVDTNNWTRTNFARWMFEDEPRAIVLTPRRWHRKFFSRSGAYES